jgi:hypothetical protein
MLEHADAALESWFAQLDVDVIFERADDAGSTKSKRPAVSLVLHHIRERTEQRDNEVRDLRDDEGRVVGRQRSDRFFDIEYVCTVGGGHRDAHRALGAVIQLLVDAEQVPNEHVPAELAELGHPIDVSMVTSATPTASSGGIVIQLVVPVRPAAERDIGPPAEHLHLEMRPPPGAEAREGAGPDGDESDPEPLDRKWTTVRRRELIAVPRDDAG